MVSPVLNKEDMYRRRDAGAFGNTLARWTDYDEWFGDNANTVACGKGGCKRLAIQYELWGVQHTKIAGWPGTKLDVHWTEVWRCIQDGRFGKDYCISPMIHQVGHVQWEGDVHRAWDGMLECIGTLGPAPGTWRQHMQHPRSWRGSAALVLLDQILNPYSRDDLEVLLNEYPDHTIELSALDACFGTLPDRNAVVWEVRRY